MKSILTAGLLCLITLAGNAQFTKASLQATGLTCAMCNNAINKALKALPYVETVKSDIRNASFAITFKPSATVDIDGLKDAVEKAGFSVGSLSLTASFDGVSIASDKHVQIGDKEFCFLNVSPKTLDGEETIKVVDKNFVTAREFKKISGTTKMNCLQTGKAGPCCGLDASAANTRVYHVTI